MSVGPLGGVLAGAAGTQLAQTKGSEVDRTGHEQRNQARAAAEAQRAENAAGIGATDGEEHSANERDADGRRLWEEPLGQQDTATQGGETAEAEAPRLAPDPSGQSGSHLDLSG